MPGTQQLMDSEALVRETLERVADKWTLLVLEALEEGGAVRFSRLRQQIRGVSQKMLTKTLRQLERDGLVTRKVYPEVPPRVEYRLTERGSALNEATCALWMWVEANAEAVQQSRREYDAAAHRGPDEED
ncbi:MAG TPA: helix-turn-helix domain-containing protein [Longimicrobium sp.]|uniref:winged helix-turn-helix transcriptional regulator n=1 Tax=Longimicrobium sp. TaxID=2029185 RepID=UPI002EDA9A4D